MTSKETTNGAHGVEVRQSFKQHLQRLERAAEGFELRAKREVDGSPKRRELQDRAAETRAQLAGGRRKLERLEVGGA